MLNELNKIGIYDNAVGRDVLRKNLEEVYMSTIGKAQPNGRYVRESLWMGPFGGLKVESIRE